MVNAFIRRLFRVNQEVDLKRDRDRYIYRERDRYIEREWRERESGYRESGREREREDVV
jgi:hypothetical protein